MSKKSYIDSELRRIEQTSKLRYMSVQEATRIAKKEQDRRLDGMNEFRAALKDANVSFITRTEYANLNERMQEDIRGLRESRANIEGKASQSSVYITYLIAIIALLIALLKFFI